MKPLIYIAGALSIMAAVSSCNKVEIPYYDGMDAIFFDQQYEGNDNETWDVADTTVLTHKIYSPVFFMKTTRTDTILSVKVETTGYVRDYARPFGVYVVADSTTAIQGEDFDLVDDSWCILPGNNSTYIRVKINLTERMYKERVQIQLALQPGEHFELPFGEKGIGKMPKRYFDGNDPIPDSRNYDPSIHNIFVDCMLSQPSQWPLLTHPNTWGEFTVEKFAEILKVVEPRGWTAATFNNYYTMQTERQNLVNREFAKYLRAQYDKGEYVLEADGRLMWIKNTLVTWGPDTRPEDIQK